MRANVPAACGLRQNGGADSGIPEFRSIGGGGAELWFNAHAPAVAAARALKSFNADPFIHEKPHERTALKLSVIAPSAEHALRVEQLRRWVEKASRSPSEKLQRNRIRLLLGMSV
jgi:hypothetical protein